VIVAIVTIAYNSGSGLLRLVETASSTRHDVRFYVFLHSCHAETGDACEQAARSMPVTCYPYAENRGVSRSWNEGALAAYAAGADVVLIANDDIVFSPGDIDKLAGKALRCRGHYIVSCAGYHQRFGRRIPSLGYSCFALNPIAFETLGCFDENIFPAYCEDQDYAYRARLAVLSEENCAETLPYHAGSAAIFSDPGLRAQNSLTHARNLDYYRRKWGGEGGAERFTCPFGKNEFTYYIAPDRRHAPYGPGYDRTDHDIVRI